MEDNHNVYRDIHNYVVYCICCTTATEEDNMVITTLHFGEKVVVIGSPYISPFQRISSTPVMRIINQ